MMEKLTDKEYARYFAMGYRTKQQVDDFLKSNPATHGGEETVYVKMRTDSMHSPSDGNGAGMVIRMTGAPMNGPDGAVDSVRPAVPQPNMIRQQSVARSTPTAGTAAVPVTEATRQALDYYARLRVHNLGQ